MKQIDTTEWADFLMEDLFDVVKGARLTKTNMQEGTIRHIGASQFDNGITAMIANNKNIHRGNLLTACYDGPVGTTFYQAEPFWATDAVNVLYPRFELTEARAMFLIPVIQEAGSRFNYGDKWGMEAMKKTPIKLPAVDGEPDWDFIESVMTDVMASREQALDVLADLDDVPSHLIDTNGWSEFKVVDLFENIERGKGSGAGSFLDGDVPYIAASYANNGYVRGVKDEDGSLTSEGNCIALICNGNGGIGRNTYQSEPFVGSSDLQLAYHPRLNEWNGLFLVACLDKSIERFNYSFSWKRNGEAFQQETVFLPTTTSGEPDWAFMEATMRSVMAERAETLDTLTSLEDV